ncbi:hypothetical protein Acaty_m0097 (plasmid) [Acidithiobacillus caldus ATCC 51756]|uniref:Uncharacterized protein n=1 Tax=Acidithiobacillus caldus (strain ATCC 51756 / DSM 8584 / KU) TaxID=637389 RepID=A0A059ZYT8_ACICK|nr:hypothetical protein Acaty_m0097 [Acidithiobacillus caldus ATCC 51756]
MFEVKGKNNTLSGMPALVFRQFWMQRRLCLGLSWRCVISKDHNLLADLI